MCKSVFEGLSKFISWQGLSQTWIVTVPVSKEKCSSFNFIFLMLKEINSRPGAKITTIFRLSWKYSNYIIKTF